MPATFTRPVETLPTATATAPAVQGLTLPEIATAKQARTLAKSLMARATESAFISSKTTPASLTAYAVGVAILGAVDNQSAPLERLTKLAGDKVGAAVRARLEVVAQATAAGRSAFKAGAESVNLHALFALPMLADLTDAGLEAKGRRIAAETAKAAQERENAKRAAAVQAAAEARTRAAVEAAAAVLTREANEFYRESMLAARHMDNAAADAEWAREVARRDAARATVEAAAEKAAWLEAKAEEKVKDLGLAVDLAAAQFRALAARFGVVLTDDQQAAIAAHVAEEVRALAPAPAPALAPAPAPAPALAPAPVKSRKAVKKAA